MKKKTIIVGAVIAIACVTLGSSLVVTQQNEYKLIRQFGRVNRVIEAAGVSLKIPFIQSADTLPKEMLLYDMVR